MQGASATAAIVLTKIIRLQSGRVNNIGTLSYIEFQRVAVFTYDYTLQRSTTQPIRIYT